MEEEKDVKNHLLQLEKTLLEPEVRSNPQEIKKLLAKDFFEFGSSGRIWRLDDQIGDGGLNKQNHRKLSLYDLDVNLLANDVAFVTYKVNDETRKQHTLRSSIWKKIEGEWRMYFHQGTIIQEVNDYHDFSLI
ncbi:DUF4440 domain-containing protein [Salipaludibacillus daqingensis]|uniref:nuclear transport factor 2 family protein n=1 Tax=Salipaludibacillus daqingensis TaxID=3041001 RepID=UPI0024730850|nr:DUF4440 domain-containing protein [Salipaludibacillus daqingensis]